MKNITKLMVNEYNMKKIDWMGYRLNKNEYGGLETRDNGAILCSKSSHPYIHLIEYKDIEMYEYINSVLKVINTQGYMPTKNQLKAIDEVLRSFEREYIGKRNNKGKLLIKEEYVDRIWL